MGSFLRHPKTTQERRQNNNYQHLGNSWLYVDDFYCRVKIRPSRNWRHLPNAYDDLPRRDFRLQKNWKNKRLTQYK